VISYLPFLTIVRGLCGLQGRETRAEAAAQIQHHLRTLSLDAKVVEPYLNHLFTLPVEDDIISTSSPDLVRQRTVEALKTLLLAEVQHRPGVLILEDVHWIDTASEEVLTALVTAMGTSPLLLVLVYRPEYVHAWAHTVSHIQGTLTRLPDVSSAAMVRAILAKPYAIQVLLERLPPTQSQAMVQDILGTTGLPPQVEQFIATKTDGNPLFVEELTRALVESGVLVREPEGYRSRTALTTLTIPAAVQGVLLARVDRLPEALKTVLQTASVIGRVFSYLLLAGVVPPGTELDRSLLQLEEREFVYPLSLMPHHELSFKHVLTQEVVYDSLLQERRRALHARIVTAIEALAGEWMADQVELLAHHALRGEVWDKALTYLRQAGEKAMALSAYSEAVGYFEQALGVLPHLPEQRDTREQAIDLRLALRMALLPSGDLGRMLAVLREAETLAVALDDPRRLGRVSGSLSLHFYFMGAYDQAIATAQRALALATASGDIVLHAEANRHLGFSYHVQGDYRRAIDGFKQTMAFFDGGQRYERFSLMLPTVQCRAWLAWCHAELGMFAEGRVLGEEGLRIAEAIAHPASLMAASWGVGLLALRQGDLSTALPLLERAVGICQEASIPSHFPLMAAPLGAAYTLGGRVADAVPPLTKAVAQTTVMEMRGVQALCSLSLGEAQLLVGRLEEAHALAERTLAHARAHQERGHQAYALRLLGEIAARREPLEAVPAADYYWQALALAEELGMCPLVAHCHRGLGVLYASIGQREQARTELSTAIALYRALDMTFWLPQVEAALAQMSGC
jgi:tetratricopeptide (TPR) repeat protein